MEAASSWTGATYSNAGPLFAERLPQVASANAVIKVTKVIFMDTKLVTLLFKIKFNAYLRTLENNTTTIKAFIYYA